MKKVFVIIALVAALQLAVVSATYAAPPAWGGGGHYHHVQYGETLHSIGRHYDADPYCIADYNGIWNTDLIYADEVLYIPASCGYYGGPGYGHDYGYGKPVKYPGYDYCCDYGHGKKYGHDDYGYGKPVHYPSYGHGGYYGSSYYKCTVNCSYGSSYYHKKPHYGYDYTGYYYNKGHNRYSHTCGYQSNCW